jgi:hypothetical protein
LPHDPPHSALIAFAASIVVVVGMAGQLAVALSTIQLLFQAETGSELGRGLNRLAQGEPARRSRASRLK